MESDCRTLLLVNVHFSPNSFGGATVVAENMAEELATRHGWRIVVITTHQSRSALPYSFVRYTTGEIDVFSIVVPEEGAMSYEERYQNPKVTALIEKIIARIQIDIAHVHSIQLMGIGVISALRNKCVPVVTTVHDCWWFCERFFMIDVKGRYCQQRKINPGVCRYCVSELGKAMHRNDILATALKSSNILLFPSEFHRSLYLDNEFPPEKCVVNKNGVKMPGSDYQHKRESLQVTREHGIIRFGFVGGPGDIKGAGLIKKAFTELPYVNYQLLMVDGARNRGLTWAKSFDWSLPGEIVIVPPYNQKTLDDFFASIDVLLFPSQWKESFGLTVREAISRGVWVIATEAGGLVEDCIEGVNANTLPMDGDHVKLKEIIGKLLEQGAVPESRDRSVTSIAQQADELNAILLSQLNGCES